MSDLKPCPFCGGEPELMGGGETSEEGACWWVRCHACGCSQGVYLLDDSGVEAIEAWNRRAQPAPITSESGNQAAQGASAITSVEVPRLTRPEQDALYRETSKRVAQLEAENRYEFASWFFIAVELIEAALIAKWSKT